MKILNFGSCNLDYVYSLHHIVENGETEQSEQMEVFPGGKGLNQSIALSKAGATVYHAGCIGSDGALLRDVLHRHGVLSDYLREVDAPTGHAIIQVSRKGENAIFIHSGANGMLDRDFVETVLADFGKGDIIVLQNEVNLLPYLIDRAHEKGMFTVLNPSPMDAGPEALDYTKISLLVLNEIEGERLTGEQEPTRILGELRRRYGELRLLLTLGDKGSYFWGDGQTLFHPSFSVPVVDTTAAGDTFLGYFVRNYAEGHPILSCLKTASAAAGIAVSRKGASPSIPYANEVEACLPSMRMLEDGRRDPRDPFRAQLREYIEKDLARASLAGFAKELGYAASYTGKLVSAATGRSFSEILQEARCTEAARLLRESERSVGEIIASLGYSNESFFRDKFRAYYGMSPNAYRKSVMNRKEKDHG